MTAAARSPCVHRSNVRAALFERQFQKTPKVLRAVRPCRAAPEATQEDAASNVTAGQPEYGRQTYKPETYNEMLGDAAKAMARALDDGQTRMEVEFPAVPTTDCALPLTGPQATPSNDPHRRHSCMTMLSRSLIQ